MTSCINFNYLNTESSTLLFNYIHYKEIGLSTNVANVQASEPDVQAM